jgi:hypothetical protein
VLAGENSFKPNCLTPAFLDFLRAFLQRYHYSSIKLLPLRQKPFSCMLLANEVGNMVGFATNRINTFGCSLALAKG